MLEVGPNRHKQTNAYVTPKYVQTRKTCVRISRGKTNNHFPCQKGVRQGCPLSPLLFNLFTSGLKAELKRNKACVEIYNTSVDLLIYADDIVLLSSNQSGLQKHLNTLELFCQNWKP